jgi:hypothetical protein
MGKLGPFPGIHISKFCSEQEKVDEEVELCQNAIELEEDVIDGREEKSVGK